MQHLNIPNIPPKYPGNNHDYDVMSGYKKFLINNSYVR